MSLIFNDSNFLNSIQEEAKIKQHVFYYQPSIQNLIIKDAIKIVVHCWGGGGGGGGALSNSVRTKCSGAGGGGSFTILDFPFYPNKDYLEVEVQVGKGGSGGYCNTFNYFEAENGGDTIVKFKDRKGRIFKEFVSYGGKKGEGNGLVSNPDSFEIKKGGDGGMNTTQSSYALMGANYVRDSELSYPNGGDQFQNYGDHCQMNYLSVSGSGGGANYFSLIHNNDGGSFVLQPSGKGGLTGSNKIVAGGGGSTYYGKGGDGGEEFMGGSSIRNFIGKNGEINSGAGGGGSVSKYFTNETTSASVRGGDGANGMAVIEVYY